MNYAATVEAMLAQELSVPHTPPRLSGAMRYAVFSGGARIRPRLCLAVAAACGVAGHTSVLSAATAVELLHCASLVHDDLPCFDNAAERRGQPTVHQRFGEALAVLAGDALIVAAFRAAARARDATLMDEIASAAASLVAGQGWESEVAIDLDAYHAAKTGALFEAAAVGGALPAGDAIAWRQVGAWVGKAYQLADDITDLQQDGAQPNLAAAADKETSHRNLHLMLRAAREAVPPRKTAAELDGWFAALSARMP